MNQDADRALRSYGRRMEHAPLSAPSTIVSGSACLVLEDSGGDGPAIVCLHSGVTDRRSWRDHLGRALGSRVVTYDRRGFGATTYEPEPHDPVADLLAVLDHLGLDQVVLVGNSQGGRIALDAALEHADRVAGLALVCAAFSGGPEWPEAHYPPALTVLDEALSAVKECADPDAMNRLEAHLWLDGWRGPEGRVGGAARELFLAMNRLALTAESPGEQPDREPVRPRMAEVAAPTLVVEGALDLPWAQTGGRQAARMVPDGEAVVLDRVGHLPGLERPDLLADLVRGLLTRTG